MNNTHATEERERVLLAFQEACECPTAEQIIDWVARYPQFAEDIRAHAAISRDWAARKGFPPLKPDESLLASGFSQVLDVLYKAQIAPEGSAASTRTFQEMMNSLNTNVPELARKWDISRSVLADLVNGAILAPVGERLVNAFCSLLGITKDAFDSALSFSLANPRLGHAKAAGTPIMIPRKYEDVIRSSGMLPERTQYWLGE